LRLGPGVASYHVTRSASFSQRTKHFQRRSTCVSMRCVQSARNTRTMGASNHSSEPERSVVAPSTNFSSHGDRWTDTPPPPPGFEDGPQASVPGASLEKTGASCRVGCDGGDAWRIVDDVVASCERMSSLTTAPAPDLDGAGQGSMCGQYHDVGHRTTQDTYLDGSSAASQTTTTTTTTTPPPPPPPYSASVVARTAVGVVPPWPNRLSIMVHPSETMDALSQQNMIDAARLQSEVRTLPLSSPHLPLHVCGSIRCVFATHAKTR
jgi:hypothetical protein